jgi:CheY-like chemotaxis protein
MRPTILIVDDDRLTCEIIHEVILMRYSDWRIVYTDNGVDAVTFAHMLRPNLILLNSYLPATSCDEIATQIRGSLATHHIPLVLMKDDNGSETKVLRPWYCTQLEKPFSLHSLYEVLDHFMQPGNTTTLAECHYAVGSPPALQWFSARPVQAPIAPGAAARLRPPAPDDLKIYGGEHLPLSSGQEAPLAAVAYPL